MKYNQPISCIIPAYNESAYIEAVLDVVAKLDWIEEIIVVNDASNDRTLEVLAKYKDKIKIITHKENLGKGAAMVSGVKAARYDLLLFLDADLIGLKKEHILQILSPIVFTREADLVLGVFALKQMREHTSTKIANWTIPAITGQRALWRKDLPSLTQIEGARYGVDLLITRHIPRNRRRAVKLDGLAQVKKEQKQNDLVEVAKSRFRMYKEVLNILKEDKV
jgi:glycosyltransferase involved in cell wall biosynthesis